MPSDPRQHNEWTRRFVALVVGLTAIAGLGLTTAAPLGSTAAVYASAGSFSSVPLASWRTNGVGRAVLKLGDLVYVGGSFTRTTSPDGSQNIARANLAAFDVRTGALIDTFRADTDGRVDDLLFDGTSLLVAGSFRTIGGVSRARIAALDPATGAVRPAFRADADNAVSSMSLAAGRLYVAGSFAAINGIERRGAAAVSPMTGQVDPTFAPSVTGIVRTVAASPDATTVYIGGPYTSVNGDVDAVDITPLDGASGAIVGPAPTEVTGFVDDLEVSPDGRHLIAAHSGVPGIGNRTAVYDTATGAREWRDVVDGDVQSVHLIGDTVWSGFHDGANGDGSLRVLGYDLATGVQDTTFRPHFDRFMGAWEVHGDARALVVAGDFSTVTGVNVEGFAIFPASGPTAFAATVFGDQSWRFLDNGTDQGTAWRQPGFDDTGWRSGIGEFGYGDGGERTHVSYGSDPNDKHITTYFRTTFTSTGAPNTASIYMRVDDGAVVYVNGVEAVRDNMPSGPIGHETLALARNGGAESSSRHHPVDPLLLRRGTNTIAVEVRQARADDDDLSFFATFTAHTVAVVPPTPPPPATPPPVTPTPPVSPTPPAVTPAPSNPQPASPPVSPPTAPAPPVAPPGAPAAMPPSSRTTTATVANVLDLRAPLAWSVREPGTSLDAGWNTTAFDDRSWSYAVARLFVDTTFPPTIRGVGQVRAVRTRFTADPNQPLLLVVRAAPDATVFVNGIAVERFPAPTAPPPGGLATARRLDRQIMVDPRLLTSGTNIVAIEYRQ